MAYKIIGSSVRIMGPEEMKHNKKCEDNKEKMLTIMKSTSTQYRDLISQVYTTAQFLNENFMDLNEHVQKQIIDVINNYDKNLLYTKSIQEVLNEMETEMNEQIYELDNKIYINFTDYINLLIQISNYLVF